MKYTHIIAAILVGGIGSLALDALFATTVSYRASFSPAVAQAMYINTDTTFIPTPEGLDLKRVTTPPVTIIKPTDHKSKIDITSEPAASHITEVEVVPNIPKKLLTKKSAEVFTVPFFSQLTDITDNSWKKVGCGITSLAMLIEYYHPGDITSVDSLLAEGVRAGAYNDKDGWSYSGLISVAQKYGLSGSAHDYKSSSIDVAFAALEKDLADGPVMASVHYTFKPTNPIPHLVIINGIKNNLVYYNDPAGKKGGGSISIEQFKSGWKKRYIEFYPQA